MIPHRPDNDPAQPDTDPVRGSAPTRPRPGPAWKEVIAQRWSDGL